MTVHTRPPAEPPSNVGDILRLEYAVECIDLMSSYLDSLRAALTRGNVVSGSEYWKCCRACGKTITTTLAEIEKNGGAK